MDPRSCDPTTRECRRNNAVPVERDGDGDISGEGLERLKEEDEVDEETEMRRLAERLADEVGVEEQFGKSWEEQEEDRRAKEDAELEEKARAFASVVPGMFLMLGQEGEKVRRRVSSPLSA
ncbi:MAG: hypothetical protein MJA30_35205 [Cytophagales bacterium]|nr:hypothetical protein [Cytophagales bacterium]